MKDEQIARDLVADWLSPPNVAEARVKAIAAALATARREGFDACKEQAAEAFRDKWHKTPAEITAAIRALEPKTAGPSAAPPIASPPDLDSDEDAFS